MEVEAGALSARKRLCWPDNSHLSRGSADGISAYDDPRPRSAEDDRFLQAPRLRRDAAHRERKGPLHARSFSPPATTRKAPRRARSRPSNSPTTGTRRSTRAGAISAISPIASRTSTRSASRLWTRASRSIARRATATWLSSARPINFDRAHPEGRLPSRPPSRGRRCPTPAYGERVLRPDPRRPRRWAQARPAAAKRSGRSGERVQEIQILTKSEICVLSF